MLEKKIKEDNKMLKCDEERIVEPKGRKMFEIQINNHHHF